MDRGLVDLALVAAAALAALVWLVAQIRRLDEQCPLQRGAGHYYEHPSGRCRCGKQRR